MATPSTQVTTMRPYKVFAYYSGYVSTCSKKNILYLCSMKNPIRFSCIIFVHLLLLASCSQKQFSFRTFVNVSASREQSLVKTKEETISMISRKEVTQTSTQPISLAPVIRPIALREAKSIKKEVAIIHHNAVTYTYPTDSIKPKTIDPNQHNDTALAIMGIAAGVFGILAFGLILGGIAIALGIITLRMAETRGKSRTLPLIALALGLFDVFFTLVFISTVL